MLVPFPGDVREALLLQEAARGSKDVRVQVTIHERCGHSLARELRGTGELDDLLRALLEIPNDAGRPAQQEYDS